MATTQSLDFAVTHGVINRPKSTDRVIVSAWEPGERWSPSASSLTRVYTAMGAALRTPIKNAYGNGELIKARLVVPDPKSSLKFLTIRAQRRERNIVVESSAIILMPHATAQTINVITRMSERVDAAGNKFQQVFCGRAYLLNVAEAKDGGLHISRKMEKEYDFDECVGRQFDIYALSEDGAPFDTPLDFTKLDGEGRAKKVVFIQRKVRRLRDRE